MTVKSHVAGPTERQEELPIPLGKLAEKAMAALGHTTHWLASKTTAGVRALQFTRMTSTLSQLSDAQLDYIGISRAEIPVYAESLLWGDRADD